MTVNPNGNDRPLAVTDGRTYIGNLIDRGRGGD
jgi:hypothetical protein